MTLSYEIGFSFLSADREIVYDVLDGEFYVGTVNLTGEELRSEFLYKLESSLGFPEFYKENINLDSFDEGIRDLSWIKEKNIFLVVNGAMKYWLVNYFFMGEVMEIVLFARKELGNFGKNLIIIFYG